MSGRRSFILSDTLVAGQKPAALLTANRTKSHHFFSQAEQRQFAFNTHVNPRSQNIYAFAKTGGKGESRNIVNNLELENLYTLTFAGSVKQYNLESWFNRYESGYSSACALLRQMSAGRQSAPRVLETVLKLKLLGILRNPYNRKDALVRGLFAAAKAELPPASREFAGLIAARPGVQSEKVLQETGCTAGEYTGWLADLYALLADNPAGKSLFERLSAAVFAGCDLTLLRFNTGKKRYGFPDSAYAASAKDGTLTLLFPVAADMALKAVLPESAFLQLPEQLDKPAAKPALLTITDVPDAGVNPAFLTAAHRHFYGQGANYPADYC